MIGVAQGSLLLGAENLELLYTTSPIRAKCTGFYNRHVSNTPEQNQACADLEDLYNFFKKESEISRSIKVHCEKIDGTIDQDSVECYFESKSWKAIDTLLPKATEQQKRAEHFELRRLKLDLERLQRNRELNLLK